MRHGLSGIVVSLVLAVIALFVGSYLPLLGSSVLALVLGMLLSNGWGVQDQWQEGLTYVSKRFLQWAIILLGFTFSIQEVSAIGLSSLRLSLVTIGIAFVTAYLVGKRLGLASPLTLLIGFGTAICGGSAIAAASPIIEADDESIALSMSTIFCFNIMAVMVFPALGHALQLSDIDFGLWAGTAVNDTSSVLAAAYSYSQEAGDNATIVKLARALMIIPSCLLMAGVKYYRSRQQAVKVSVSSLFPWFILWFLLASIISSTGLLPTVALVSAKKTSQLLMAMALVGIGSKVSLQSIKQAGFKPLLLGFLTWIAVALSSLVLQQMLV